MPRDFFDGHVKPNYSDWLDKPLDERLAKNAVSDINVMAERVFHNWKKAAPGKIYRAKSPREYREELANRECADFGLVRDIADAHKHFELDRANRRVTRADQTQKSTMGWGESGYGEGAFGGTEQLIVKLDDGTKRPLSAILENTMAMWERLLLQWGL